MNLNTGDLFNTSKVIYAGICMSEDYLPKRGSNRGDTSIFQMLICTFNFDTKNLAPLFWNQEKLVDFLIHPSVHPVWHVYH